MNANKQELEQEQKLKSDYLERLLKNNSNDISKIKVRNKRNELKNEVLSDVNVKKYTKIGITNEQDVLLIYKNISNKFWSRIEQDMNFCVAYNIFNELCRILAEDDEPALICGPDNSIHAGMGYAYYNINNYETVDDLLQEPSYEEYQTFSNGKIVTSLYDYNHLFFENFRNQFKEIVSEYVYEAFEENEKCFKINKKYLREIIFDEILYNIEFLLNIIEGDFLEIPYEIYNFIKNLPINDMFTLYNDDICLDYWTTAKFRPVINY